MWWLAMAVAQTEIPYDGIDQDGDGVDLIDVDGDGFVGQLAFGRDCNDRDATVHPDAIDTVGDKIDSDCDGGDGPRRRGLFRRTQKRARSRRARARNAASS